MLKMLFVLVVEIILTILVIRRVLALKRVPFLRKRWFVSFLLLGFATMMTYGFGSAGLVAICLSPGSDKSEFWGAFLVLWIFFLCGLFPLRHFLGVVFSREKTVYYSDDADLPSSPYNKSHIK